MYITCILICKVIARNDEGVTKQSGCVLHIPMGLLRHSFVVPRNDLIWIRIYIKELANERLVTHHSLLVTSLIPVAIPSDVRQ